MALTGVIQRRILIGGATLSILAMAGTAATLAAQGAFAQSSPTPDNGSPASTAGSNEDPAHEANETAEQEAAEDSGQRGFGHGGPHNGHSNEDPAHEAAESPEREAQEDAAAASNGQSPGAPSNPSSSSSNSSEPAQ